MTYLKIEHGKGFFLNEKGEMQEIHEIRKEDILRMLDLATDNSVDFEGKFSSILLSFLYVVLFILKLISVN